MVSSRNSIPALTSRRLRAISLMKRPVLPPDATVPGQGYVRLVRATWAIAGLIESLLAIRFGLLLFGASPEAGFVQLISAITGPLVAPFANIFPVWQQGGYRFEPASLVALAVYPLLGWGFVTLFRLIADPDRWRS